MKTKHIFFGIVALVVGLAGVEILARTAKTMRDDVIVGRIQDWLVTSPTHGWKRKPSFSGRAIKEHRTFDDKGYAIDGTHRDEDTRPKILLIGDSVTYGYAVDADSTFAVFLENRIGHANVVNLGVPGYSSYQGLRVLEDELAIATPALVVVGFSYNDRRYVAGPRHVDSPEHFQTMARWSKVQFLSNYYTFRHLRSLLSRLSPEKTPHIDLREASVRVSRESYRSHFAELVRLCRKANVPILFLVTGDNPRASEYIRKGMELDAEGQPGLAIRAYQESITGSHFADLARIKMAMAYEHLGDVDTAKRVATVQAMVERPGAAIVRLDSDYFNAMFDVAHQERVGIVDLRAQFKADPSVFIDSVHLRPRGHRMVADALYDFLADRNWFAAHDETSDDRQSTVKSRN